ncbi:hypothetical protein FRC08_010780 [Ceratobasidium sp. 394]|nr:hypothetical protein FRC08_010780 [Ceratobasidium sp. 394]KAG9088456.1 hypothetical protein FS749_002143 [Ceratobasidium sp. UAMH 11750]
MSITIDSLLNTPEASIVGRKRSASCVSEDAYPPSKKCMLYSPSHDSSFESLSTMANSDSETESYTSNYELTASPARCDSPYLWHWLPPLEEQGFPFPYIPPHYQPEYLSSCPTKVGVGLGLGPITKPSKKLGIYGDKPRRPISQPRKIPYPILGFSTSSPLLPSSPTPELRHPSCKLEYPSPSAIPPSPIPTSPQSSVLDLMARCLVYSFTSWELPPRPIYHNPSPDPSLHLPPIDMPSLTLGNRV